MGKNNKIEQDVNWEVRMEVERKCGGKEVDRR